MSPRSAPHNQFMSIQSLILLGFMLMVSASTILAQETPAAVVDAFPTELTLQVDDVERRALIVVPTSARSQARPLVFVFHGHGGTMRHVWRSFAIHRHWPNAIVVFPQGLNTPGALTDPEGKKPGWQTLPGQQADRDLKFFDVMLARLKRDYQIDESRIYATGHSNGAAFTYLLWAVRGDALAAVAPSAGVIRPELRRGLKPKPALILAGEQDRLVKFEWQNATIEFVKKLNQCTDDPTSSGFLHSYASKIDVPLQSYIYPGGHKFAVDAVPLIVTFFKNRTKLPGQGEATDRFGNGRDEVKSPSDS